MLLFSVAWFMVAVFHSMVDVTVFCCLVHFCCLVMGVWFLFALSVCLVTGVWFLFALSVCLVTGVWFSTERLLTERTVLNLLDSTLHRCCTQPMMLYAAHAVVRSP